MKTFDDYDFSHISTMTTNVATATDLLLHKENNGLELASNVE